MKTEQTITIDNWKFRQKGEEQWLSAHVPSFVHTDLRANGKIADPFDGDNEKALQWIDKVDWEYETSFTVDQELLNETSIEFVFNGLDTYADVYLNDQLILQANNMFRVWHVDVKSLLSVGDHTLTVHLKSPIQEDLPKLAALGYHLPASNDDSEMGELGDRKVSIFARKAPYHYGWDWGPRFVTSGIWKPIELKAWSETKVNDFYINQKSITEERAVVDAEVIVQADSTWSGEATIQTEELFWKENVSLVPGENVLKLELVIDNPKLWWCHGYGEQHQYTFEFELKNESGLQAQGKVTTGLRSVKHVRNADQHGTSFYIELNGEPIFIKGANHIPNDSFVTEITKERFQYEIKSAVAANMNMLRVWGGGVYEDDYFYQLCDEQGILVWQDFMFACSMYPGDEAFLENVKQEAADVLKQLRSHPSIVFWCGNNEIDAAWAHYKEEAGWGWKQDYDQPTREKIWHDYQEIFHHILADQVASYAPNEPYWPSSPLVALTDDEHQHATKASGSGDLHYWDVWHGKKPFEAYNDNISRFMSEYGFQSFPELRTIDSFAHEERDLAIESKVMLHHQKNGAGNRLIKTYMDEYLPEPKDFRSFLYMSQVLQAEGIKTAIEAHRRNMPYCMGTLYWQINDCWPVASWSSIDYFGRWKALQYFVKKAFKPIILSVVQTKDQLEFHGIADRLLTNKAKLIIQAYKLTGELLNETSKDCLLNKGQSTVIAVHAIKELIGHYDREAVVIVANLEIDGKQIDQQLHYLVRTKQLQLPKSLVTVTPTAEANVFNVHSTAFAKNIWLDTAALGYFTNNYFDLLPGEVRQIDFIPRSQTSEETISVDVYSMQDMI
ncbi:beta-mannosidase [Amphibacillus marinus]|uniref:Beta-mannosidase B n=1 Tax=Amphibacillus marinus TaxID=872970 RepID=A0A1H8MCQ0_9BACI|nr:glycoside hydrolase family 2 protein [Amphibacillus marinus]SEO15074.1 beta-mannosidase [Amphibacillus marinus]